MLAGGASERFGSNKALAAVPTANGRDTVLAGVAVHALRLAGADPVVLVGGDPAVSAAAAAPMIHDRWPGEGPLGGLATALAWANAPSDVGPHVVVTPCDLPLLTAELISQIIAGIESERAVLVSVAGRVEPILGAWPASWAESAVALVRAGHRRMSAALELGPWISVELPSAFLRDADTPDALRQILGPESD